MLLGAHVSAAGGISKAIDRIEEIGGNAVQVFTQSPRMWRPTSAQNVSHSAGPGPPLTSASTNPGAGVAAAIRKKRTELCIAALTRDRQLTRSYLHVSSEDRVAMKSAIIKPA